MLEAAIALQIGLGEFIEAALIGGLLLCNATLGFIQEGRRARRLRLLKSGSPRPRWSAVTASG